MRLERLQQIIDAYGADPARWPGAELAAAEALLARSAEARAALAEARRLDDMLDAWTAPAPDPWAAQRIAGAAHELAQRRPGLRERLAALLPFEPVWPQLAGLAAALVIGFFIGFGDFAEPDAGDTLDVAGIVLGISSWEYSL
ncbi:MAG: hypothetical protein KIT20_01360 [Alphaproteobacteria bacterium]|nr:hypothetical protein [Alphaproteobacteria bacterium]